MRVQLFSRPQQQHASSTKSDPADRERCAASSMDSIALDRTISPMATQRRRLMRSRKISSAMSDVATISKLFSSDAFSGLVRLTPSISRIGAAMSSTIMPIT